MAQSKIGNKLLFDILGAEYIHRDSQKYHRVRIEFFYIIVEILVRGTLLHLFSNNKCHIIVSFSMFNLLPDVSR